MSWSVVIPVKRLDEAKTRLQPGTDVAELAFAFALDTVAAAMACAVAQRVIVVTSDARVAAAVRDLGAVVVEDPGVGLNAAVAAGVGVLNDDPVAVLTGDLPAVRPADLEKALLLARGTELAMVADRDGSGTTLLTARSSGSLHPHFGVFSRARHERGGHVVLEVDESSPLRRDVDTADDLASALLLGVGCATAAVIARRFPSTESPST